MSSKFSSFEKEQKLFENWRSYLKKDTASLLKEQIREPEPEPDPEPEPIPEVSAEDVMAAESELSALEAKVAEMEATLNARREQLVNLRRSTSPATAVRQPRREEEVPEVSWEDLAQHGIYPDE
jgi:hypothetical protein